MRRGDEPIVHRELFAEAHSDAKLETLRVLAYDPDERKLVRVSIPFWLIRMMPGKHFSFLNDNGIDFDTDRVRADVARPRAPRPQPDPRPARSPRCLRHRLDRVSQQDAHAQYDPGVRASLAPYPQRTLLDYLADAVRERPDHPAVLFKGRALTCAELDRLSDAFAAALVTLGVRKGDRVALILPNSPQFMIAELGAWKIGATVVPLNPMYTEHELQDALSQTGAEIVVALTPFVARVKACQSRTRVRLVIATNIKEYLPPLKQVLFTLFPRTERRPSHPARTGRLVVPRPAARAGERQTAEGRCSSRGSGHHPDERRHHRHAQGRRRAASLVRDRRPANPRVGQEPVQRLAGHAAAPAAAVSRLRQRRRPEPGAGRPQHAGPDSEPARNRRRARHHRRSAALVFHRRPDVVHRAVQSPAGEDAAR
jgi:hypothetical protein